MDHDDWIDLYRAWMPPLYRAVSRRVGGKRELAEDVTQETWLRALRAWRTDGVPGAPGAWLRAVAFNLLRNHFRRPAATDSLVLDELEEGRADPDENAARSAELIQRGLARLRPEQAGLLASRHFDGASLAEIAAQRGLTERAVEGRLRRARAALARHVDPDVLEEANTNHR